MDTRATDTRAQLTTFLGLTFGLSAVFWWLIISAGSLGAQGGTYVLALMWSPGVSALITRLIFQRNVRGQGWGLGAPRWAALAYVLPLGYATVAYGLVWLTGSHPLIALTVAVVLISLAILRIWKLSKFVRRVFRRQVA